MSIDINTVIHQAIGAAVAAEVVRLKSDLQLTSIHLQQQVDELRRRVSATNDRINDLSARTDMVGQTAASALLHEALDTQVQALQKEVSTLLREKDIEDEQFTTNVRQIAREVYDELQEADNDDDDTSAVLDQDNENARIRGILVEALDDTEFADALRDRIVEMFQNGAMTISIDKV